MAYWFSGLSKYFVTGQSDNFGFGFSDNQLKPPLKAMVYCVRNYIKHALRKEPELDFKEPGISAEMRFCFL